MKDPAIRETWAKRVEQWKESGLSAKAFGAEIGINPRSLSWWRWELAKGDPATSAERPRRRRSRNATTAIAKTGAVSPLTFVEMTAAVVSTPLEVVLPSTLRVRVPVGFDDAVGCVPLPCLTDAQVFGVCVNDLPFSSMDVIGFTFAIVLHADFRDTLPSPIAVIQSRSGASSNCAGESAPPPQQPEPSWLAPPTHEMAPGQP